MKKWTKEQEDFLKKNSFEISNEEITKKLNKKFKTNYTILAVKCKKEKLHIISNYRKVAKKYTPEIIEFIKENYQGKDNIELANLLNKKFKINTDANKICDLKANLKRRYDIDLRTGINKGCFKKGDIPVNKGKTWDEYMPKESQIKCLKSSFKKGNIPYNYREIGTERVNKNGYIEVKIQDGALNNNWEFKHRYIYEQHYGKIPKGYKVIFLDGNINNFSIDNLKAVSSHEELIMNEHKLRYSNKELTNIGHLIAKIEQKRRKLKNDRL
jgi:hypothetical protein